MVALSVAPIVLPTHLASEIGQPRRLRCSRSASVGRCCIRAVQTSEAGVATDHKPKHQAPTMFQKLGGTAAIQGVVDEFYTRVFADDDVKGFFEGINKQKLKAHQVEFMTYAFGGPEEYHGKDMWKAHEKLVRDQGLNDNHFDIIVKHLVGALQKFNVPEEDIQAAGKVVETTRHPMFTDPNTKEYLG